MERRQRILMVAVGMMVAAVLASRIVPWVIKPFAEHEKKMKKAKEDLAEYKAIVEMKSLLRENYRDMARKTFADDPELKERATEAGKQLHAIMSRVANKCKLDRLTVNRALDRTKKGGVTITNVSVTGQGPLAEVVRLLEEIYKLPYLIRVRSIALTPTMSKKDQIMKVKVDVESLVLPPHDLVGDEPLEVASAETTTRPATDRLQLEDKTLYRKIAQKDIFSPQVRVAKTDDKRPTNRNTRRSTPKGKDTRGNVLVTIANRFPWTDPSSGQQYLIQEACTRDTRTKEKLLFRVGDKFHNQGILIYVDSRGAVVREGNGWVLFPVGKTLKDSEPLTPETHPYLYHAVQQQVGTSG